MALGWLNLLSRQDKTRDNARTLDSMESFEDLCPKTFFGDLELTLTFYGKVKFTF